MARMTRSDIELFEAIAKREAIVQPNYAHSRNLTGEPSEKNRVYQASDNCWKRGLKGRTRGIAAAIKPDGILDNRASAGTVRVITSNGSVFQRDANEYRAERKARKQRKQTQANVSRDLHLHAKLGSIHT